MQPFWRLPVTLTAAVVLAAGVYHWAERAQHPPASAPRARLATLNTDSLVALHEMLRSLVPVEEILPASPAGVDATLATLGAAGLMQVPPQLEATEAADLSGPQLERIEGLIGGLAGV